MITVLSITGCVLAMTCSWFVSQGRLKPVYILGIITSACFIAINTILAIGGEPGVLLLIVPSAWAIVTSVIGLRRLRVGSGTETEDCMSIPKTFLKGDNHGDENEGNENGNAHGPERQQARQGL